MSASETPGKDWNLFRKAVASHPDRVSVRPAIVGVVSVTASSEGEFVSGRIPENVIADVRDRTDIVQVIGQYVELKRAGTNHKGLCPFHEEKTPSFNVNGERQFYHCFGCRESGDVFTFLMKIEGRPFAEVVEDLAGRAGIDIPRQETPAEARAAAQRRSERQRGQELNAKVAALYQKLLQSDSGRDARAYLARRGIGDEVAATFKLGWAPPSAEVVVRLVKKEGVGEPFAEKLGLLGRRRQGPGYYDRFWNRLIFPLIGVRDDVIGFGGRLLVNDPNAPKYVNTPETFLYHKGEALYGLHASSAAMRRTETTILVEGNFDVLQLHQHGFENAVAPMGTALTEGQVRLLRRFSRQVVAVFDGDAAGQAAARKAVPQLVAEQIEGKIATLPKGEDPDSLLLKHGTEALAKLIDSAVPAIDFLIETLRAEAEVTVFGRARVLEQVAPLVARLQSAVARDLYADRLAMALSIERDTVRRAIAGDRKATATASKGPAGPAQLSASPPDQGAAVDPMELDPLAVLVEHPHLFGRAEQANLLSLLTSEVLRATYSAAAEMQRSTGQVDVARLLQMTSPQVRDAVAAVVLSREYASDGDPTRALDDCLLALQRRRVDRERKQLQVQIEQAQSQGDSMALGRLLQKLNELLIEERRHINETR